MTQQADRDMILWHFRNVVQLEEETFLSYFFSQFAIRTSIKMLVQAKLSIRGRQRPLQHCRGRIYYRS